MPDIKKKIKYEIQQIETLDKLLKIIDVSIDKYVFTLYDLDNNEEKINKILELKDDIRKYYSSSCCSGVNTKECKRPYLSIIRYILKHHNYTMKSSDHSFSIGNNITIRTKKYHIIENKI